MDVVGRNRAAGANGRLQRREFPRSNGYDPAWVIANVMGPHPLWLMESLTDLIELRPGDRVLDLGCGKALTSVFLAREFGARVTAADLWISPTENWARITEAGVQDGVVPVHAEAHRLPFADAFFDVIVTVDAYHYFGTDDLYLGYVSRFLRPGGVLAIAVPGVLDELEGSVPEHAEPYWDWQFASFHTPAWWRRHWEQTGLVEVETADVLAGGAELWRLWNEVCAEVSEEPRVREAAGREAEMLRVDAGRTFCFSRIVARRP